MSNLFILLSVGHCVLCLIHTPTPHSLIIAWQTHVSSNYWVGQLECIFMQTNNEQKNDLSQQSLGFRIWIYFCCILINIAVATFLIVSKLIIIILWPLVRLSLILEYLSLKLRNALLEERLKNLSEEEEESDSRTWKMNSKSKVIDCLWCITVYTVYISYSRNSQLPPLSQRL